MLEFRPARKGDEQIIYDLIVELAVYEKMKDAVVTTPEELAEQLFEKENAKVILPVLDGTVIGYAFYFHNFSTWLGKPGLYLEDLYIKPEYRKKGYGKALLKYLADLAIEEGCGRMEWACLNWNQPSIDFYLSLGAEPMTEWKVYRLEGEKMHV